MKKIIAISAIAAGLVVGGATAAHATTAESPYVTVAWSYEAYPDKTQPQPFIASVPGADLSAFDTLAASAAWCGKPIQVDVYQRTAKDGTSWEILKETGSLLYAHDGGFLGYGAGVGTPYKVITSEEFPCIVTPTPLTSPTPEPSGSPSQPTPSEQPSPPATSPAPTPSQQPSTPAPSAEPSTPAPASPTPTAGTTTLTPASSTPSAPSASTTTSAAPVAASTTSGVKELAFTGADGRQQVIGWTVAAFLMAIGIALLFAPRVVKRFRRN